jgi:hypothetical protein
LIEKMNTKDFIRLGVPLGEATRPPSLRYGATRQVTVLLPNSSSSAARSRSAEFIPLHHARL